MKYFLSMCIVFMFLSAKIYAQSPVSFRVKAGVGCELVGEEHGGKY